MTPAQPSTKPKQTRQKHGLTHLLRRRCRGDLNQIDGRSVLAKTIQEWRGELIASMGGREGLSAQQTIIIDLVVRDRLAIESIEAWLAGQPSLVNKRRRCLYPIVQQLASLKDGMTRRLIALGLERKVKPVLSLTEYLTKKQPQAEHEVQ